MKKSLLHILMQNGRLLDIKPATVTNMLKPLDGKQSTDHKES